MPGVQGVDAARPIWIGHESHAALDVTVGAALSGLAGHDIAEVVHCRLLDQTRRLTGGTVHVESCGHGGTDPDHATGTTGRPRPGPPA